jgi:curved DNA-binding protein
MASNFRDYYAVLGLTRNATDDEIKSAYRKLAREHHPDLHQGKEKETHHRRMQEVNEAYSVLSSKEDRAKYDQFGEHWKNGPPPPQPDAGFSSQSGYASRSGASPMDEEAFSDFFRQAFGGGARAAQAEEMDPSELDIEATLELSLEDAVRGAERTFSLTVSGLCSACRGTGRKGKVFCPVCGGVGEVRRAREVTTKLPAGLLDGSRIRLRGQGSEGAKGRGDLYLRIHLMPDPRFRMDGANLETDAGITPWRAALGGEMSVATLDGPVRVRVPKGARAGNVLRLAGKGLGKPNERGDLFVRLRIDNPPVITPEMEALFKQLEEKSDARVS